MYWHLLIFSMVVLHFLNAANSRMGTFEHENHRYAARNLYDDKFKDITNKIDMLSTSNDDLHSKFDRNNRRHEEDLTSLKNSLEYIKKLLQGSKESRVPYERERKEHEIDLLLTNNIGEELNKLMKKLFDVQHNDLQDVKDALRNETNELRDQFEKQNRLLAELEAKFRQLDQQLKINTRDGQYLKVDNIADELNSIMKKEVGDKQSDLQDIANTLKNTTIDLQDKLQKQNQLLTELQKKFNRLGGQNQSESRERFPLVPSSYRKVNNSEDDSSARKKLRDDQYGLQDFQNKLKNDLQFEFQKQNHQLTALQEKVNQMDQQITVRLERESFVVKNEIDGGFQKQRSTLIDMQEKCSKVGQQIKTKVETESHILKNVLQEELQKQNRLLIEMQERFNRTDKEIQDKLDTDSKRVDNLTNKLDKMRIELSTNMQNIKDSLKDVSQKEFEYHNGLLAELRQRFDQTIQLTTQELNIRVNYTIESLTKKIFESKEDVLEQQKHNIVGIKDALQTDMREESQKQSSVLNEIKEKYEKQIAIDLEKERNLTENLNKMQKELIIEQQKNLKDVRATLQKEFQNERNLIENLNKMQKELSVEQQKDLRDVKATLQKGFQSERYLIENLNKVQKELIIEQQRDIKATLQNEFQNERNLIENLNKMQKELIIRQQQDLRDVKVTFQNEFEKQNLRFAELQTVLNKVQQETSRIVNLGEEISKMKDELLAIQRKSLDDIKDSLRDVISKAVEQLIKTINEMKEEILKKQNDSTANIKDILQTEMRGEFQKQNQMLSELKEKHEQQVARNLERERNMIEQLNKMQKEIIIEQQKDLRDVKATLQKEFQNEFEKQILRLSELQTVLNKVQQETSRIVNLGEEISKTKDELLAVQRKNLEDIKDILKDVSSKTVEQLIKAINEMKEEILKKQNDSTANIKDILQAEMRGEFQKQNQMLIELKEKHEQQVARDLEKERNFMEQLNRMQNEIITEQQKDFKAVKDTLQREFQNSVEKQNLRFAEVQAMLDKIKHDTNRIGEELSKTKEDLLADQHKNLKDTIDMFSSVLSNTTQHLLQNIKEVKEDILNKQNNTQNILQNELDKEFQKSSILLTEIKQKLEEHAASTLEKERTLMEQLNQMKKELSNEQAKELQNVTDTQTKNIRAEFQKQFDLLTELNKNYGQQNEDMKNMLTMQSQLKDQFREQLNAIMKDLQSDQQNMELKMKNLKEDILKHQAVAHKELRDALQSEFVVENLLLAELKTILNRVDQETNKIGNLSVEIRKTKEDLLANQNKNLENVKILRNETADLRGELQKQFNLLTEFEKIHTQQIEGIKGILTMQSQIKDQFTEQLNAIMKDLQSDQQNMELKMSNLKEDILKNQAVVQKDLRDVLQNEFKAEAIMLEELRTILNRVDQETNKIGNLSVEISKTKEDLLANQNKNLEDVKILRNEIADFRGEFQKQFDLLAEFEKNHSQQNEDIKSILTKQIQTEDKFTEQLNAIMKDLQSDQQNMELKLNNLREDILKNQGVAQKDLRDALQNEFKAEAIILEELRTILNRVDQETNKIGNLGVEIGKAKEDLLANQNKNLEDVKILRNEIADFRGEFQKQFDLLAEFEKNHSQQNEDIKSILTKQIQTEDKFIEQLNTIMKDLQSDQQNMELKLNNLREDILKNQAVAQKDLRDALQNEFKAEAIMLEELRTILNRVDQDTNKIGNISVEIGKAKEDLLANQNKNLEDVKILRNEIADFRGEFQKQFDLLAEFEKNHSQQNEDIKSILTKQIQTEDKFTEQLNAIMKDLQSDQQNMELKLNNLREDILKNQGVAQKDLRDALQNEFKAEAIILEELRTILNRVDQETNKIGNLGVEIGKAKEDLLANQNKNLEDVKILRNEIADFRGEFQKQFDLLAEFEKNHSQQNEDIKSILTKQIQTEDKFIEQLNTIMKDLQSDQQNMELKLNNLREDILKNQAVVQKDLRDVLQNEFKAEAIMLEELRTILNRVDQETNKIGNLSVEIRKTEEDLLANQNKNLEDVKILRNEIADFRGEFQKQFDLLTEFENNHGQQNEDIKSILTMQIQINDQFTEKLNAITKNLQSDQQNMDLQISNLKEDILKNQALVQKDLKDALQNEFKAEAIILAELKSMLDKVGEDNNKLSNLSEVISKTKEELLANQRNNLEDVKDMLRNETGDLRGEFQKQFDLLTEFEKNCGQQNEYIKSMLTMQNQIKDQFTEQLNAIMKDLESNQHNMELKMSNLEEDILRNQAVVQNNLEDVLQNQSKAEHLLLEDLKSALNKVGEETNKIGNLGEEIIKTKELLTNQRSEFQKQFDILAEFEKNHSQQNEDIKSILTMQIQTKDKFTEQLNAIMKDLQSDQLNMDLKMSNLKEDILKNQAVVQNDLRDALQNEFKAENLLLADLKSTLNKVGEEINKIGTISEEISTTKDLLANQRSESQKHFDLLTSFENNHSQQNEDIKSILTKQIQTKDQFTEQLNAIMKDLQSGQPIMDLKMNNLKEDILKNQAVAQNDLRDALQNEFKAENLLLADLKSTLNKVGEEINKIGTISEEISTTKDLLANQRSESQKHFDLLTSFENNHSQQNEDIKSILTKQIQTKDQFTEQLNAIMKDIQSGQPIMDLKMNNLKEDILKNQAVAQNDLRDALQNEFKAENLLLADLKSTLNKVGEEINKIGTISEQISTTKDLLANQRSESQKHFDLLTSFENNHSQQNEDIKSILTKQIQTKDQFTEQLNAIMKDLQSDQLNMDLKMSNLKEDILKNQAVVQNDLRDALQNEFKAENLLLADLKSTLNKVGDEINKIGTISEEISTTKDLLANQRSEFQKQFDLLTRFENNHSQQNDDIKSILTMQIQIKDKFTEQLNAIMNDLQSDQHNMELKLNNLTEDILKNQAVAQKDLRDALQNEFKAEAIMLAELKSMLDKAGEDNNKLSNLSEVISKTKEELLANQRNNLEDVKDMLRNETGDLRGEFQKQFDLLTEFEKNCGQQNEYIKSMLTIQNQIKDQFTEQLNAIMKDLESNQHNMDLKMSNLKEDILKNQAVAQNDLRDALQNEFKAENLLLADLKSTLNKVGEEINKIGTISEEIIKTKDLLASQGSEFQKQFDLLPEFEKVHNQQMEGIRSILAMQIQIKDHLTEHLNAIMKELQSDQQNMELRVNKLKEDILKNEAVAQKDLKDSLQNEFKQENLILVELESMLNKVDEETNGLGSLGEKLSKTKDELLADQRKFMEDVKDVFRNHTTEVCGEFQKNYGQLNEDMKKMLIIQTEIKDKFITK